jgi:hypothetical protein
MARSELAAASSWTMAALHAFGGGEGEDGVSTTTWSAVARPKSSSAHGGRGLYLFYVSRTENGSGRCFMREFE